MYHTFQKFAVIGSCLLLSQTMFARERTTSLHVSATVQARARWMAVSPAAVTVGVTMYPNVQAQVWAAKNECGTPVAAHQIAESGIQQIVFTPQELDGANMFCLASSDGILQSSANRPQ